MAHTYPPLNVEIRTPRLTLAGATDELLERLVPVVRAGIADVEPLPFDDPISFYADSPEREWQWLQSIWRGRGRVTPDAWRLYFAVLVDGEAVGMQDLTASNFTRFGTVSTSSWLAPGSRGRGLGTEMRAAILHLAFAGLGAREAGSDAFVDNEASNRVSRGLGYEPNGTDWDTRRGEAARIQQWRLTRETWERTRRDDIHLSGVRECLPVLGIG
ncbi:GNAT family N-acetyltransferase [Actinocatenispora rupis]|uniref:Putative succinyl-CoA transferase n=1 Tax=Actinocatenispora rupis TaxID=519421 RepID=A0A8J3NFM6_9ACTN|nr:GNAT family protein [Actinocatenispora rupis]GID15472.1 putative succinyl-CoA transferase [Actinocatenispora rupis]